MQSTRSARSLLDIVISLVENGDVVRDTPFVLRLPANYYTGRYYTRTNILRLIEAALVKGYSSHYWLTYKQARALGGFVRKGEHGTHIPFYAEVDNPDANEVKRVLRYYTVFNIEQCDGLPQPVPRNNLTLIEAGEAIYEQMPNPPPLRHMASVAPCWFQSADGIVMPPIDGYNDVEMYYQGLYHELIHSTAHPSRLNRDNHDYNREELVAEVGSLFLMAFAGLLTGKVLRAHAGYLKAYLDHMKQNPKLLYEVAVEAGAAAEYIISRTNEFVRETAVEAEI